MQDYNVEQENKAIGYKCDGCGASLQFDPQSQMLKCEHCGFEKPIEFNRAVEERSFSELFSTTNWRGDIKVVRCDNCGAKEVLDSHEISTSCPFCGSPSVLEINELPGIKPDTAIPFKVPKESAAQKCLKWLKSRFFAPNAFKKNVQLNSVRGCYLPMWTFDCRTEVRYEGQLGKYYTETYVVNGKTMTRTKVRYFHVSGNFKKGYNDIYVKGSQTVSDNYLQKLEPFYMNDYVKYDDKLLAGFEANHYTVEPLDAWNQAEQRIYDECRAEIIAKYDADTVSYLNLTLIHEDKSFKYLLLPVYISATNYKNKLYNQYVNGVSGTVAGKVPKSPLKIALVVLGCVALVAGIALLANLL